MLAAIRLVMCTISLPYSQMMTKKSKTPSDSQYAYEISSLENEMVVGTVAVADPPKKKLKK